MAKDTILKALDSEKSTIIFGDLGRYPSLLEYYLRPHVLPKGNMDDDPPFWFLRHHRNVFVVPEPPFGYRIPNQWKYLIFTSHLDLEWDPLTTDVITCQVGPLKPRSWKPDSVQPCTIMEDAFQTLPYEGHMVVLFGENPHKTYLEMLNFEDKCPPHQTWSISWPDNLQKSLQWHLTRSWDNFKRHFVNPELANRYWLPPSW